jgi:hypothetical protein
VCKGTERDVMPLTLCEERYPEAPEDWNSCRPSSPNETFFPPPSVSGVPAAIQLYGPEHVNASLD